MKTTVTITYTYPSEDELIQSAIWQKYLSPAINNPRCESFYVKEERA